MLHEWVNAGDDGKQGRRQNMGRISKTFQKVIGKPTTIELCVCMCAHAPACICIHMYTYTEREKE